MATYKTLLAHSSDNNPDFFKNIKCEWTHVEAPPLNEGDVQIAVHFSSINYKDALAVTGKGKILRTLPLTPGIDAAGIVKSTRSKDFKEGDEVFVTGCGLGELRSGGFSEVITVPDSWVVKRPSLLTLKDCMILGTAGFTAGLALHQLEKNDLSPAKGDVLVTGATGGVGCLSLLLLNAKGYSPVAWTRKETHLDRLKNWGATRVENHSNLDLKTRPLESATWVAAIDNVGGDILSYILPRIQPHGSVASIGLARNSELTSTVFPFILRGVNILGISSATCPRPLREKIWDSLNAMGIDWKKALRSEITSSDLVEECNKMISGSTWGRIIVNMQKG